MEHYKSTLATAAVAAFGLVAAAHILHPGNYEDLPRPVPAPVTRAEAPSSPVAWVDPPARANAVGALPNAVFMTAQAAEAAPIPSQRPTMAAAGSAVRPEGPPAQAPAEQVQKPEAPRRHKLAQRRGRVRQASLTRNPPRGAAPEQQTSAPGTPPNTADRFDPIGSLIHGLGLDS